jgi:hypothetical protein
MAQHFQRVCKSKVSLSGCIRPMQMDYKALIKVENMSENHLNEEALARLLAMHAYCKCWIISEVICQLMQFHGAVLESLSVTSLDFIERCSRRLISPKGRAVSVKEWYRGFEYRYNSSPVAVLAVPLFFSKVGMFLNLSIHGRHYLYAAVGGPHDSLKSFPRPFRGMKGLSW